MRYKLLGNTGMKVSEISLGTMTFGDDWGWGADKKECKKMWNAYVDRGGNFIDTANFYTGGSSERFVGEFMLHNRDYFVCATKYTLANPEAKDPNLGGNSRKNMMQSVEASLKRLNTDYIDLLWLHIWDGFTPIEEVMRAFEDLVKQGKVLHIGFSDTPAWIVSRGHTIAQQLGWAPVTSIQVEYSLVQRDIERELLPMADELGMSVLAWSPLKGGLLTGKYTREGAETEGARHVVNDAVDRIAADKNLEIAKKVDEVADEIGVSSAQTALNWVRQRSNVIPIVGTRKLNQLEDLMKVLDWELSDEHLEKLNEVSKIELGFPHDFRNSENIRKIYTAGTFDKIEQRNKK